MACQNPGIFRDYSVKQGINFIEIDLHAGDEIPDLTQFDGLWVMGGSMNVWEEDRYPWLIQEKQAIHRAVKDLNIPFLGICLGHQLVAEALGGKAEKTDNYEVGLFAIEPTEKGLNHPLLKNFKKSDKWVNVHLVEVVEAPKEAVILATSDICQNHVMQLGEFAYSCQFHPEVCEHTLDGWLKIPGIPEAIEDLLGVGSLNHFKSSITENLPSNNAASLTLFENWCNLVFNSSNTNY